MTRNWGWLLMIAIAGVTTSSLFLAATDAQDARDAKLAQAQKQGWLTFDQCLVIAPESSEIAAKEEGTIGELTVSENDLVKIGQSIGQLDSRKADLEKEKAAKLLQRGKVLAKNDKRMKLAELFLEETKMKLQKTQELVNKGGAPESEVREKAFVVEQAEVQLIDKQLEMQELELQADLAESSYQLAALKVRNLKLTSPVTGAVVKIDRRAGEWVAAGTTIAKVIRLDELRVDFFADRKQVDSKLHLQQPVMISADFDDAGNKDFSGKITAIASEVGSTGKVRVSATVQNQQINDRWILLPGMPVVLKLVPKS